MPHAYLVASALAAALAAAPAQHVTPGDNLAVDGIPPIPAELSKRLNQYQNMRTALLQDWIPGGGGALITTRFAQTAQVHVVPAAGGRRTQLTFFDEQVRWTSACPRKGCGYLLFGMDAGGSEFDQVYRLDLANGRTTMLSDGKSKNGQAVWNPAGDRVAYSSTRRNGKDFDLYLLDPMEPGKQRLLAEVQGEWSPLDFSPDGKRLLVQNYVSINESHLYVVDVATGQRRPLTPEGERGVSYPAARFSKNGERIYLTTDRDSDFVRLGWVDADAKAFEPHFMTADVSWDVEDFDLSGDGKRIAIAFNEGGVSTLRITDADGRATGRQPRLPMGVISGLRFQRDGGLLGFTLAGPRTPGDVYAFDLRSGRVERWTWSETGGLDASAFSVPELVRYPTFDQVDGKPRQIPAFVYLPPKRFKAPYPVLINVHGGPEGQSRPWFLGKGNHRMDELGIAVIYPNVRGSAGYGKQYLLLDNGSKREDSVRDLGALLDWIKTRPDLDASRVCVVGGSYGGFMSLAALTHYSDRLRCGISYVGISNFVTFLQNTQPYRQDLRRAEYGDERIPEMREFLDRVSPLTNADRIKVPLLVVQGANDPRVPASESDQIVAKVRQQGGPAWYLLAKDEGHGFVKKANADFADLAMTLFLQKYLLDEPAPKLEQAADR